MGYMHREMNLHTVSPSPPSRIYVQKADTHSLRHRDANIQTWPTLVLAHAYPQAKHTHTQTYMHLKVDIFLALVLTTCACKLEFQNVLILC